MSDSQRLVLTISLCMVVLFGYQMLTHRPPAPATAGPSAATGPLSGSGPAAPGGSNDATGPGPSTATASGPTGASTVIGPDGTIIAAPPPEPVVTLARRDLDTNLFSLGVRNRDGAIERFALSQYRERENPNNDDSPRVAVRLATATAPLEGERAPVPHQARLVWETDGKTPQLDFVDGQGGLSLTGENADFRQSLSYRAKPGAYGLDYEVRLENRGAVSRKVQAVLELSLAIPPGSRDAGFLAPPTNVVNGICYGDEGAERHDANALEKEAYSLDKGAHWAAIDRQYFVVAASVKETETTATSRRCDMKLSNDVMFVRFGLGAVDLAPGESYSRSLNLYLGPKRDDTFAAVDPQLQEAIDFNLWGLPLGALARPMLYLLAKLHGFTGSWGVAIMLLTLIVKLVLFPVTFKSIVSMRKMQLLKPEMDKLKERFKDDPQRQQMEQLKLFKDKGVSPFGGCIPMLLQMPVWFALYRALWSAVDLYEQPFLWIGDLTTPEKPLAFLAIACGIVTIGQQMLTPQSPGMDPVQQKIIRYVMPAFLIFVMWAMPSGLVLYVLINSLLSVVQQLAINRMNITV